MKVIKRDGSSEPIKFDKISARIKKQTYGLNTDYVDHMEVTQKVIAGIYDGITTRELDDLASKIAAQLTRIHHDYSKLAARIAISSLKKYTKKSFTETIKDLYNYINPKTGEPAGLISDEVFDVVMANSRKLDQMIIHDRDFDFDFFGFKTLERAYLLKIDGEIAETPQHMYLRVALGIWTDNLKEVQKTYDEMSNGMFTHATPTLFNAGTKKPQLSSCFLLGMEDDSIKGIYNTLGDCADISQSAGGIGLHIHDIRAKGSYIKGTNGTSNGIVPMLQVYNATARYVDQGGGKRKGSIAVYIEPWHADIYDFIPLRKNHGKEEMRARDLFLALWIPDLFMERVEADGDWTLMCPNECPGLSDVFDSEDNKAFTKLYKSYEAAGKGRKTIKARDLYSEIIEAQMETGTPYMLYKDAANAKSNQKNIGTIKSSNLCMTADQRVVTNKGYLTVKELHDSNEELILFNGQESVKSSKMKLRGEQEDVYKITLENGMEHKVTAYHGIPVIDSRGNITRVECKDLNLGDKIAIQTNKGLFGDRDLVKEAYLLGLYQSDGTQNDSSIMFDVWENDFDLVETIETYVHDLYDKYGHKPRYSNKGGYFLDSNSGQSTVKKKRLTSSFFKDFGFKKGSVPTWIWESNEETQWSYLKGLLEADGTVNIGSSNGNPVQLSYVDVNKNFLKELQLIFNNLGLQSSIKLLRKGGLTDLPNGKGGHSKYYTKDCYRLIVSNKNDVLVIEEKTNFLSRKKVILENRVYRNNTKKSSKIESITYIGKEDVYCPTVYNDEHIFIAQGMKTFNCTEIMEVSNPEESAVCNLASIALPKFVTIPSGKVKSKDKTLRTFNHDELYRIAYQVTVNLNRVIDVNWYPTEKTKKSNMRHRPIGLGVQGLADAFAMLGLPFESEEAKKLNKEIFETIYFASMTASKDLAKKDGAYETFEGSPLSKGIFQYDMWDITADDLSNRWDWNKLKKEVVKHGARNSLLLAPMPTASTAQILGNNECFEPYTTNIYKRNVLAGEYVIVNKHLIEDLINLGLWNDEIRLKLIKGNGSIQHIDEIPDNVKEVYKTVWEMRTPTLMEMARDRGIFICQSQSMNVFMRNVNAGRLSKAHMYSWKLGLKTGMYYLRSNSNVQAKQTLGVEANKQTNKQEEVKAPVVVENVNPNISTDAEQEALKGVSCSLDNPDACEMCSG